MVLVLLEMVSLVAEIV
jgi:hypothetical protein